MLAPTKEERLAMFWEVNRTRPDSKAGRSLRIDEQMHVYERSQLSEKTGLLNFFHRIFKLIKTFQYHVRMCYNPGAQALYFGNHYDFLAFTFGVK